LYRKLLRQFLTQASMPDEIERALAAGDWPAAERLAHTVHGVAANLGARGVQARAADLEQALRERAEAPTVAARQEAFRANLDPFVARLRAALPPDPAADAATVQAVDPQQLADVAAQMQGLLGRFDAAATELFDTHRDLFRALLPPDRFPHLRSPDHGLRVCRSPHHAGPGGRRQGPCPAMNASPADSRVLIVEDAPANIQALTAILREKGYAISIATNGRQALDVLASVRPDLILLDVMMPEMDGFETCSRIKASPQWRDIPIIFLTAKSETGDIVRGFELGAVDYVAKPFHAHELLARVHTHLAMDRLRRENELLVRAESENARHRSVAQMVAGVAHEINTPLGVINTAASLLTRWLAEPVMVTLAKTADGQMMAEDLAEAAGLITRNAHRAHKLVQDFKKVSVNQITDVRETNQPGRDHRRNRQSVSGHRPAIAHAGAVHQHLAAAARRVDGLPRFALAGAAEPAEQRAALCLPRRSWRPGGDRAVG
jgi:CheY-like chemotaxis protein/HPt (histidine-containing phosphotransfer) domain-containing protein